MPPPKRGPSSLLQASSTMKRAKLDLPQDELTSLNFRLNHISKRLWWPQQLQDSEVSDDPDDMTLLLQMISMHIIQELTHTSAKVNFISPFTLTGARRFVEDFNPNERREWEDGIRTCMQRGDWSDLITHPSFQKPRATAPNVDRASSETTVEQAIRLHAMFGWKYQGDFHKLFVQALDDYENIYDPKKHFGRIIPIIQSSATGKSRMVKEIGNEVPTLSICFRRSALPESGWPPSDKPAYDFLLGERPEGRKYKGEELAAAFLGAVMVVVAEKIESRGDSVLQKGDWMSDWRLDSVINIVDSPRYTCFAEVAARAEKLLLDNHTAIVATRVSSNIQDISVDDTTGPVWHKRLFNMFCRPSFEKLSQILKKRNVKWFLLAFDECSELNSTKPVTLFMDSHQAPLWSMSLTALRRIIKAYDDFVAEVPFWFLLLDTNSYVIDMGPLGEDLSGWFEKRYRSLPAWPYVGFNQMAKRGVFASADEKKLPTHVHSLQHLKRYGRPFWAMLTDHEVLRVASMKLFSDYGFRPHQDDHVFIAFAAVRRHMRILDALDVDSMVITTSPPEPMLAIAAALAMNELEITYQTALTTLLDQLIRKGVVLDRGLRGGLSSRLLLLRARDKAMSGGNGLVKIDPIKRLPMVHAVELSIFLQTLLGDTLGLADEQRDVRNKLLQEASSVWINFTHIYQTPLSIGEVTESMLVNAWSTGTAFQCAHSQPVIEGFIVGYRGSLDEPFQSSRLITIRWQSKAGSAAAAAASTLADSLTSPCIVPQNDARHSKPWHVVILMDIAAPSAFRTAKGPHCDLTCETNESEEQVYYLDIRGYRAVNYPVLKGLEQQFDTLFTRALGCPEPELVSYSEIMAKAKSCMILD